MEGTVTHNSGKVIRGLFFSLFAVQALSAGLPLLNTFISSLVIGNLIGTSALAAIGFTAPLCQAFIAASTTVSIGAQMLCGQKLGKGDKEGVKNTYTAAVILCVLFGFLFTAVCLFYSNGLSRLLGAEEEALQMTADYIKGYAPGLIFMMLSTCMLPFLQLDGAPRTATASIIAMAVVSVGANLANGLWLHWGMLGAGLSTSLSYILSVLICIPHFLKKNCPFRLSFKAFPFKVLGRVLYLGIPSAVQPIVSIFALRIVNALIFRYGGMVGMSAFAVAGNISSIGDIIEGGYTGSGNLVASVLAGERDSHSLRDLPRIMFRSAFFIYALTYVLIFLFTKPLCLLFGAELEQISIYVSVSRLYCLWFITNSLKGPPLCAYRAMGRVGLVSLLYFLNSFVYLAAIALAFSPLFGIHAVVSYSWGSELLTYLTYLVIFFIQTRSFPKSFFDTVAIPDSLGCAPEDRFAASVHTVEEAISTSEQLACFIRGKGFSNRFANYCALCMEEMTVDTVKNGFPKGKGSGVIDMRVLCEGKKVSILLRDDCEHFDPTEWLNLCAPEDPSRSIGIRMVSKLATSMNYSASIGLNVLTIEISE